MRKVKLIQACWVKNKWCEYCDNTNSKFTYLPFHSNVLNPENICENCAKNQTKNLPFEFEIVDFFDSSKEYWEALSKLK